MKRARPTNWLDEVPATLPQITVYEADDGTVDTGLVDALGAKIFRRTERNPIGFDLTPRKR